MKKALTVLILASSFSSMASTCYLKSKGGFFNMKTQHYVDDRTVDNMQLKECIANGVDLKNSLLMDSKKVVVKFWIDGKYPSKDPASYTVIIK